MGQAMQFIETPVSLHRELEDRKKHVNQMNHESFSIFHHPLPSALRILTPQK